MCMFILVFNNVWSNLLIIILVWCLTSTEAAHEFGVLS